MSFESKSNLSRSGAESEIQTSSERTGSTPCAALCNINRRGFFQLLAAGVGAAALAGCAPSDEAGIRQRPRATAAGAEWKLADAAALSPGEAMTFEFPDGAPGILFVDNQNRLGAVSSKCPHAGCIVQWQQNAEFRCPCHGSRFDRTGQVLTGPAEESLQYFTARAQDKDIFIAASSGQSDKKPGT